MRALDAHAKRILSVSVERSPAVRDLIAEIGKTDVIVMFSSISAASHERPRFRGQTRLMTSTTVNRIVSVRIRVPEPSDNTLIAALAHELQHVLELASSEVRSHAAWEAHVQAIGREWSPGLFETEAALAIERTILAELKRP